MRFPIDIVVLGGDRRVLAVHHSVMPGKLCGVGWRTRGILELAPGRLREARLRLGDRVVLAICESSSSDETNAEPAIAEVKPFATESAK